MTRRTNKTSRAGLPAPMTPLDCDLSGYPQMMIDIGRLRQSDFDATEDDTAWRAGLNLWFSAWQSVPAGSLRADDASLAKAAGIGRDAATWARVKDVAMHGFVLCSDGRVYHRTVCELALAIWLDKLLRRHGGQKGNESRYGGDLNLKAIEAQIVNAAELLRALDPLASALAKVQRFLPVGAATGSQSDPLPGSHSDSHSDPHCDSHGTSDGVALRSQYNIREGNGSLNPSQEGTGLRVIGGAAA